MNENKSSALNRFVAKVALGCGYAGMGVLVCAMLLTLRHAIGRYLFDSPLSGNTDIISLSVVVGIYLCMIYTMQQDGHISVGFLADSLPKPVQNVLYAITSVISLVYVVICAYETYLAAPSQMNQTTTVLNIPKGPFYYFVAVCWALLGLVLALNVIEGVKKFANSKVAALVLVLSVACTALLVAYQPFSAALRSMDRVTVGVIGMIVFLCLMFMKLPVAISMGFTGLLIMGLYLGWGKAFGIAASNSFSSLYDYTWSTVPMFIFMGYLAKNTYLAEDFYFGIRQWVGHLPGGLLDAVVIGNGAFGACSGDTLGAGITFCSISLPETRKYGYDDTLTLGCIAGGSVLAALIPPSMLFIVFGATTQTSIGRLFIAGVFPGLLLVVMYITLITLIAKFNPNLAPRAEKVSRSEALKATPNMMYLVAVFVIVIGGIYAGIFSPTEAGAFGSAAVILIGILRRRLNLKTFILSMREAGATLGMTGLLLAGSMVFQRLVVLTGITEALASLILGLSSSKFVFFVIVAIMLLIMGCFIDALPLLMLVSPILLPIAEQMGVQDIHFAVFTVTFILMGTLTPPVGIMVYALSGVVPDVPMSRIFKGVMPFILCMLVFAIIVAAFPPLSTWLVSVMFGA